jgi:hypothetical protein
VTQRFFRLKQQYEDAEPFGFLLALLAGQITKVPCWRAILHKPESDSQPEAGVAFPSFS